MAAQKRYTDAAKILNKFAKYNGVKLVKDIDEQEVSETLRKLTKKKEAIEDETEFFLSQNLQSIATLDIIAPQNKSAWYYLTHPWNNLLYFFLICYVWFTISMLFFGISLGNINKNIIFY